MTDITATTEAEVIDAVRAARDWKSPLNIVGGRTKRNLGRATASWGTVLDLSGLRGIVAYEPDELTLTVKPGTPVAEINELLATKNQHLGFEPADWGPLLGAPANKGTIGGAIAADVSGSAAIRHGRARDSLLGIRAVNGLGEAYKAGGKVVKNVTGFDLPKLMCGAMGTLGPLTELTLRVFPKPQASEIFAIGGVTIEDGFKLLRNIWASPLEATCLALLSQHIWQYFPQIEFLEEKKYIADDDGEEYGPINHCAAIIRVEGSSETLQEKKVLLAQLLSGYRVLPLAEGANIIRAINSGTAFVDTMEDVWLWHLPQTAAPKVVKSPHHAWIADWAGGSIWQRGTPGYHGEWLRNAAVEYGGTATLIRASEETRKRVAPFTPESPARAALTRSVKAAFDPMGLFNPGRMYEGV